MGLGLRVNIEILEGGTPAYRAERRYPGGTVSEEQEQITLFQWAEAREREYPVLSSMYHIPNGGKRSKTEAARLKAAGVRAGVPDICLPHPAGGFNGMYIELKTGKNTVSQEQKKWLRNLREQGFYTCVCYGWDVAAEIIELYVKGELKRCG